VLRETYGEKVVVKTIQPERGLLRRRLGLKAPDGIAAGVDGALAALEERLLWERFGL